LRDPEVLRLEVERGESIALDWYAGRSDLPPALFIPGLGSHRRGEKAHHFAARFSDEGRSLSAIDLRGHGDSGGTLRDLTMTRLLADVAAAATWTAQRSRCPRLVLIGVSMGAAAAAWHALKHPAATAALILIAPALRFPAALVNDQDRAAIARWRDTGLLRLRSEWIDVELGAQLIEDAARYDPQELRHRLSCPALLLHGQRDTTIPWQESAEFVRGSARSHADLFLIGEGDHRLTRHKELLFAVARAWLARQCGAEALTSTP
jgi:pimeloyl-ACP methyl ester carboxylesterase